MEIVMYIPRIPWLMQLAILLVVLIWETNALDCTIGQEPDPKTSDNRWVIPTKDPNECRQTVLGGFNAIAPQRPHAVTYSNNLKLSTSTSDHIDNRPLRESTDPCLSDPCQNIETCHTVTTKTSVGFECSCLSGFVAGNCNIPVKCLDIASPAPLGVENRMITDNRIRASSAFNKNVTATSGRLNGRSCWVPESNTSSWIQIDLGRRTMVTGVITQGCPNKGHVTKYEVDYVTWDPRYYSSVQDTNGSVKVFHHNYSDIDTLVTNTFPDVILATAIRIKPTMWKDFVGLRLELLGCPQLRCNKLAMGIKFNYWSPSGNGQVIQVNLGNKTVVSGVITQSSVCPKCGRVQKYKVAYQTEASDQLQYVPDGHGSEKVFSGNNGHPTISVTNMFPETILATVVRIEPIDWHLGTYVVFEYLSCNDVQ